jgi:IstB-like ATP binding protein
MIKNPVDTALEKHLDYLKITLPQRQLPALCRWRQCQALEPHEAAARHDRKVGYLPIDQRGADLLFQVISQRYERGSIVTNFVLHAWLRSGNTGAGQGAAQFLREALSLLGAQHQIRCVRADSGFYADNFLSFLEERHLADIVEARLTPYLKSRLYQLMSGRPSMPSTRLVNLASNFGTGKGPGALWWCPKKSKAIKRPWGAS